MQKRALVYTRVSTTAQLKNHSLPNQHTACQEYAEQRGWTIIEAVRDVASGARLDRPGLNRVRELAVTRAIDVVLVWMYDRLTRSVAHSMLLQREFEAAGVTVIVVANDQQADSGGGENNIQDAALAEHERQVVLERGLHGKREKAAKGYVVGCGIPPYGYQYVDIEGTKHLVLDPVEAPIVCTIFRLYLESGVRPILNWLYENNIPCAATRGDRPGSAARRVRAPSVWSKVSVYKVLRNPVHQGQFHDYGSMISVEPTVDAETWTAVQQKLNCGLKKNKLTEKTFYLLGHRIRCACGYAVVGRHQTGTSYRYYVCCAVADIGDDTVHVCTMPQFRADAVEAVVWNWLVAHVVNDNYMETTIKLCGSEIERERANIDAQIVRYYQEKVAIQQELYRFFDRFGKGKLTESELDHLEAPRRTALAQCDHQIAALHAQREALPFRTIDHIIEQTCAWREQLVAANTNELRRTIIERLDVQVVIGIEGNERFVEVKVGYTQQQQRLLIGYQRRLYKHQLAMFTLEVPDAGK